MSAPASGPPPLVARLVMLVFQCIGVLLSSIVLTTVSTSLWWRLTPSRDLDVLVYDQAVADTGYLQHAALGQLLEYHRVPYDLDDYVGLEPGTWEPHGRWPEERPDLIVLADVAGVQLDEQGRVDPTGPITVGGRLEPDQAEDIARWVEAGTPAWGEFALVTDPTPSESAEILESTFGFRSTGWRIRFFEDLAEVSLSIQDLGAFPWPYSGPGMIAVSGPVAGRQSPRSLVVLTESQLTETTMSIVGGPPGSTGGVAPYDGWVNIVEPDPDAEVDAAFRIPVTVDGDRVLARAGIPNTFAALVRTERTLYFSGDGLDDETPFRLRRLRGGATFTRLVTGDEFRVLYQVLEPSIKWLLDRVEESEATVAAD